MLRGVPAPTGVRHGVTILISVTGSKPAAAVSNTTAQVPRETKPGSAANKAATQASTCATCWPAGPSVVTKLRIH